MQIFELKRSNFVVVNMNSKKINTFFSEQLFHWHETQNLRKMPWKGEKDPYKIWLSEIILQQTRVAQGLSYYQNFIATFPSVNDLALAHEDEVFRLWQGLGYYSRARNLHHTAKVIVTEFGAKFPQTYKELLLLKGIGPYTAAAIASFAFKENVAVVDGNVVRVLARFFNIDAPFNSSKGKKIFQEKAQIVLHKKAPDEHNQAIMDFGANVCKPQNPLCNECILNIHCVAYSKNTQNVLPTKAKKNLVKQRYFLVLHIEHLGEVLIEKRIINDIWKGLFQMPMIEVDGFKQHEMATIEDYLFTNFQVEQYELLNTSHIYKQKLTHQTIQIKVFHIKLPQNHKRKKNEIYTLNFTNFAFPKIFILYLQSKSLILM
jgi:A/G-specific adenine glycosylase